MIETWTDLKLKEHEERLHKLMEAYADLKILIRATEIKLDEHERDVKKHR